MDNWIVVITFIYPHEAHLAKGVLESEGIKVLMKDELTSQVYNFYSTAIGGVKLLVHKENYEQAIDILKKADFIKEEVKEKKKLETFSKECAVKCPYCQSNEVAPQKTPGYIILFSILLLNLPLPFMKKTFYCFDCHNEWRISNT